MSVIQTEPYRVCPFCRAVIETRLVTPLKSEQVRAADDLAAAAEMLWAVIANVSGGDWKKQSRDWQEAAARWRDHYIKALDNYEKHRTART